MLMFFCVDRSYKQYRSLHKVVMSETEKVFKPQQIL